MKKLIHRIAKWIVAKCYTVHYQQRSIADEIAEYETSTPVVRYSGQLKITTASGEVIA